MKYLTDLPCQVYDVVRRTIELQKSINLHHKHEWMDYDSNRIDTCFHWKTYLDSKDELCLSSENTDDYQKFWSSIKDAEFFDDALIKEFCRLYPFHNELNSSFPKSLEKVKKGMLSQYAKEKEYLLNKAYGLVDEETSRDSLWML